MKRVCWAIFLLGRDALFLLGDNALIMLLSRHFFGVSHTSAGRGRASSHSCPRRPALCASPCAHNSLDHLTSTKSCLWALCKKQLVISASGGLILLTSIFLARRKPLGQCSLFSLPSFLWCFNNQLGFPQLGWRSGEGGLCPTCQCGCFSIFSALVLDSAELSCAVQFCTISPASCPQTTTHCTSPECSGKLMYDFPPFRSKRNIILWEKWASTELNVSKNGSYQDR